MNEQNSRHTSVVNKSIGNFVKRMRIKEGVSYEELSAKIAFFYGEELTPRTIRNLENGANATLRTLKLVIGALGQIPSDKIDELFVTLLTSSLKEK